MLLILVDRLWSMYREGDRVYQQKYACVFWGREGKKFPFFCIRNKWMTPHEIILFQCGWIKDEKKECLVPVMFADHTTPIPDALLEMIWCNCETDTPCSRCSYSVQRHNWHVPSSSNVMAEPVSTAGQYRKTVTKVKMNSNLKTENDV